MNMMMNTQSPDTTPRAEFLSSFDSCTTLTFDSPSWSFEDAEDALMTPLAGSGCAFMADRSGMCMDLSFESFELAVEEESSNSSFDVLKRFVETEDDLEDYEDSVGWSDDVTRSDSSFATAIGDSEDNETFWTACDSFEEEYDGSDVEDLIAPLFSTPTTEIPEVVCPDLEAYIDSDSLAEYEWTSTGMQNIPPLDSRFGWDFVEDETEEEEEASSEYVEETGWESKNRYVLPEELSVIYEDELPEMIGLGLELVRMTSSNIVMMPMNERIPRKFSSIYSFFDEED